MWQLQLFSPLWLRLFLENGQKKPKRILENNIQLLLLTYFLLIKVYETKFNKIEHLLIYLSVFLLFSSTGFMLIIIIFFLLNYEHGKLSSYVMLLLYGVIACLLFFITKNINPDYAQKISFDYFYHIKTQQCRLHNNLHILQS